MNDNDTRPFGYWITAVDRLMRAEFGTVFEDEGITRRDWRMLNRIDDGERAHDGRGFKMRRLRDLGWVERTPDGWALTEAGALAKRRLGTSVDGIRARVADALTPDEYAAMAATLEKIAREFGWEEGKPLPRPGRGREHRHGHSGRRHVHPGHHHSGHGHDRHGHEDAHNGHLHDRHGFGRRHLADRFDRVQHVHFHTHH
ncbi:hypothetical protein AB0N64_09595 [Microbacterium sp. NPDC089318]